MINVNRLLVTTVGDRAVVSPQNSYARAGIPEFWLCLAAEAATEVYRAPGEGEE